MRQKDTAPLDRIDQRILAEIQKNADQSQAVLADKVGLSAAPCWRRLQKLKEHGFVKRTVSLLDRKALGLNAMIFAQVKLSVHGRTHLNEFTDSVARFPEVLECYVMMGDTDFLLRIVTESVEAYERFFFEHLSRLPGVQEIKSTIALSEIKSTTELPIRGLG
jgi:Lrp/AsnC family transcriptional regulator